MGKVSPKKRPKIYFDTSHSNNEGLTHIEGMASLKAGAYVSDNLLPINNYFLKEIKNRIANEINEALYGEIRKELFQLRTLLRKVYSHFAPSSGDFYEAIDLIEEILSNIGNYKIDFDLGDDDE